MLLLDPLLYNRFRLQVLVTEEFSVKRVASGELASSDAFRLPG
jgi:hypothetical protein